jgi:hypothetical protein
MTKRPDYIIHHVDEKDFTVDWFFGDRPYTKKIPQLVLVLLGWFFAVLPVVITASAIVNRNDQQTAWWSYREGFVMWDVTISSLAFLVGFFILAFYVLYLINRALARRRIQKKTYNEQRLAQRLELAGDLYAKKYGPEPFRLQQRRIQIEPYGDLETYELRDHHRTYGVD